MGRLYWHEDKLSHYIQISTEQFLLAFKSEGLFIYERKSWGFPVKKEKPTKKIKELENQTVTWQNRIKRNKGTWNWLRKGDLNREPDYNSAFQVLRNRMCGVTNKTVRNLLWSAESLPKSSINIVNGMFRMKEEILTYCVRATHLPKSSINIDMIMWLRSYTGRLPENTD